MRRVCVTMHGTRVGGQCIYVGTGSKPHTSTSVHWRRHITHEQHTYHVNSTDTYWLSLTKLTNNWHIIDGKRITTHFAHIRQLNNLYGHTDYWQKTYESLLFNGRCFTVPWQDRVVDVNILMIAGLMHVFCWIHMKSMFYSLFHHPIILLVVAIQKRRALHRPNIFFFSFMKAIEVNFSMTDQSGSKGHRPMIVMPKMLNSRMFFARFARYLLLNKIFIRMWLKTYSNTITYNIRRLPSNVTFVTVLWHMCWPFSARYISLCVWTRSVSDSCVGRASNVRGILNRIGSYASTCAICQWFVSDCKWYMRDPCVTHGSRDSSVISFSDTPQTWSFSRHTNTHEPNWWVVRAWTAVFVTLEYVTILLIGKGFVKLKHIYIFGRKRNPVICNT